MFSAFIFLLCFVGPALSGSLAVKSRWIVDETGGTRVKLACVNWVSHLQPMVTEGLSRQPLKYITSTIVSQGFNCVRLTWATFMVTNPANRNQTVQGSLNSLNLSDAAAAMAVSNPEFLDLTLMDSYKRVVAGLGEAGLMVILDNHISRPQWCCGYNDGNGFFGDADFDPGVWIQGLSAMATAFKGTAAVVGMSLRNELRGSRANAADWYKYMQQGAQAVHDANPDVLVIMSGLNYDADLKFLASKPVSLEFSNKIVYEMHWYSFTDGKAWENMPANKLCGTVTSRVNDHTAFVAKTLSPPAPLFISEFGIDERGTNVGDNRFINCFLAFAAEGDFDWALWTLQGSYYIRNGQPGFEETYGIFNGRWDDLRDPPFVSRLKSLQKPFQESFSSSEPLYKTLYHPATGQCLATSGEGGLKLDSCDSPTLFEYKSPQGAFTLSDESSTCIAAKGPGLAAELSTQCAASNSKWQRVSSSNLQVSVTLSVNGTSQMLCLDGKSSPQVLTNDCICLKDSDCRKDENPEMQWFKLITTNRKGSSS